mmetsp:Transcript_64807/g.154695  ORF Transcript_64807/g.154695 Transcript_64807/m.154695 type:complete len:123 (-) Transcript_64807:423-791(-)
MCPFLILQLLTTSWTHVRIQNACRRIPASQAGSWYGSCWHQRLMNAPEELPARTGVDQQHDEQHELWKPWHCLCESDVLRPQSEHTFRTELGVMCFPVIRMEWVSLPRAPGQEMVHVRGSHA